MSDDSGAEVMAKQGSITFLGNIGNKILGFVFLAIVTRLVSPSTFGVYSLGLSIILFVKGFSNLNLHRSVDYFVPQYLSGSEYGKAKSTVLFVIVIGLLSTTVAAVLVVAGRRVLAEIFSEPLLIDILPLLCLVLPISAVFSSVNVLFNSIKQLKYTVYTQKLALPISKLVITVCFIYSGFSLFGLVGGYVFSFVVATVIGSVLALRNVDWVLGTDRRSVARKDILSYSLPLAFVGVIYATVGQIDYFVIGYFTVAESVGRYRVAFALSGNLLIFISSLTPIFKPMIVEKKHDIAVLRSRYQLATRWIVIATLPAAITLAVAPKAYILTLFTREYTTASTVVIVLSVGYLINALAGPEGMFIEGLGHSKLTLLNTIFLITTNSILDILLVPRIGIVGAGIGTAGAYTVTVLLGVGEIYYLKGIHPFSKNLFKALIAGVPAVTIGTVFSYHISNSQIIAIVLPVIILTSYLLSLVLLKGFTNEDRNVTNKIDAKLGYPLFAWLLPKQPEKE